MTKIDFLCLKEKDKGAGGLRSPLLLPIYAKCDPPQNLCTEIGSLDALLHAAGRDVFLPFGEVKSYGS